MFFHTYGCHRRKSSPSCIKPSKPTAMQLSIDSVALMKRVGDANMFSVNKNTRFGKQTTVLLELCHSAKHTITRSRRPQKQPWRLPKMPHL